MLKNREHPFPPGGYMYYQPQTGWWAPGGLTFWQVVDAIIAHRNANPRFGSQWTVDRNLVADELDLFTCLRIKNDATYCTTDDVKKNPGSRPALRGWPDFKRLLQRRLQSAKDAAVDRVENAAAGVGIVLDWLGDSLEPVEPDLAEQRAKVCVDCPQNGRPDFIQKLEGWAASGVRELIHLKNELDLKTAEDERLHHCQACDCALKLKVHAKLVHILNHTDESAMEKLPPHCWVKTEQ